jgi:hypothetical protein
MLFWAATASALSWGYLQYYLAGTARVIDATSYLLEARTFAQGSFSFEVPEPTASFRGRFLIHTADSNQRLAPIFPPGYPALLALGVITSSEYWIGPALAFGLVVATYYLTLAVSARHRDALVAASLSALCACLRYHTAETMSHGWAAFLTVLSLYFLLKSRQKQPAARFLFAMGLCLGALISTRQLTGLLVTASCALCVASRPDDGVNRGTRKRQSMVGLLRSWGPLVLGLVPGLTLLLSHHYATTGNLLLSPQLRYYSLADGPGQCFGLGLGKGCAYEHADVVSQQGGQGLTWFWMLQNSIHRLHWHSLDVANLEPMFLLGLWCAFRFRKSPRVQPLLTCLLLVPLGYAFFYFNGSYPGGGARFFSELIPIWHVLLGMGLSVLRLRRLAVVGPLLGFALHAVFSHRTLLSDHFGPPLDDLKTLESTVLTSPKANRARVSQTGKPIIFFSTAHEFNLATLSSHAFVAARRTHDDREQLLGEQTRSPMMTWEAGRLVPLAIRNPSALASSFETESDYPPLSVQDVWVHPESSPHGCVSNGRALRVHRQGPDPMLTLELPARAPTTAQAFVVWLDEDGSCTTSPLGTVQLPGKVTLKLNRFPHLTHIDRLNLTF